MRQGFTNSELIIFCEQMGMVLKSGLSAFEGILLMKEDAGNQRAEVSRIYEKLAEELEQTGILYDAMEESGGFPDYVIHMVRIGEQTGNLDEVMDSLAAYYEREEGMLQDIRTAVSYPLVMLFMMLAILLVMMIKVLPVFSQVYEQMGSRMSGPAAGLLAAGLWMKSNWGVLIGAAVLILGGAWWLFRTEAGQKCFSKMSQKLMTSRRIMEMISGARFASGISMALRSVMDYDGAFSLAGLLVEKDERMKEKMVRCKKSMEEGENLSGALADAGIMTGLNARMLYIAERTGEMDQALAKIAAQMDEEASARIQNMVLAVEPALVVLLSVLVGGILLSVMVPLMGILSSIG